MSYGDQPMNSNGDVIRPSFSGKIIEHVSMSGLVTVSSSATFAELLEQVVPLGYIYASSSRTSSVTIGGAIAADIHGKNHYRQSSIADHIESMTLMLADGETIRCSKSQKALSSGQLWEV